MSVMAVGVQVTRPRGMSHYLLAVIEHIEAMGIGQEFIDNHSLNTDGHTPQCQLKLRVL